MRGFSCSRTKVHEYSNEASQGGWPGDLPCACVHGVVITKRQIFLRGESAESAMVTRRARLEPEDLTRRVMTLFFESGRFHKHVFGFLGRLIYYPFFRIRAFPHSRLWVPGKADILFTTCVGSIVRSIIPFGRRLCQVQRIYGPLFTGPAVWRCNASDVQSVQPQASACS